MKKFKANYSFQEKMIMGVSFIYTKVFWWKARLIRLPFRMRGRRGMSFGRGFTTGYSCRIEVGGDLDRTKLTIGDNCVIGDYAHIVANHSVTIGSNVLMASRVFISDTNHGFYSESEVSKPDEAPNERQLSFLPVHIGDNVWIGENVSILAGVSLGDGCVVGANAVVTKNIPKNCIIAGNPARCIKKWNGIRWEKC